MRSKRRMGVRRLRTGLPFTLTGIRSLRARDTEPKRFRNGPRGSHAGYLVSTARIASLRVFSRQSSISKSLQSSALIGCPPCTARR